MVLGLEPTQTQREMMILQAIPATKVVSLASLKSRRSNARRAESGLTGWPYSLKWVFFS